MIENLLTHWFFFNTCKMWTFYLFQFVSVPYIKMKSYVIYFIWGNGISIPMSIFILQEFFNAILLMLLNIAIGNKEFILYFLFCVNFFNIAFLLVFSYLFLMYSLMLLPQTLSITVDLIIWLLLSVIATTSHFLSSIKVVVLYW